MNNRLSKLRKTSKSQKKLPVLKQVEIARRWQLHPDTVRKLLRMHNPPAAPGPWKRPRYSIAEVWRIEGVSAEQMSDPENHEALFEKLLSSNDLAEVEEYVPATFRKHARDETLKSIRLGITIRFRKSDVR